MSLNRLCLALSVALPLGSGGAMAQQVLTVAPGVTVVVLPQGVAPAQRPVSAIDQIFAEQHAMMARMMADMDAMLGRTQTGAIQAARMGGQLMPGNSGFCQQSISITYDGSGAPVVKTSRSGNACGPEGASVQEQAPATAPASRAGTIEIEAPAPLAAPPARHRT